MNKRDLLTEKILEELQKSPHNQRNCRFGKGSQRKNANASFYLFGEAFTTIWTNILLYFLNSCQKIVSRITTKKHELEANEQIVSLDVKS